MKLYRNAHADEPDKRAGCPPVIHHSQMPDFAAHRCQGEIAKIAVTGATS
jgi:hypothetical protein